MDTKNDYNCYSQDIFQSCSESSEIPLRRSQRILEKNLFKCFIQGSENMLENDESSDQWNFRSNGFNHCSQMKTEYVDIEITPDLTYMLNDMSSPIELSQKQVDNSCNGCFPISQKYCDLNDNMKKITKQSSDAVKKEMKRSSKPVKQIAKKISELCLEHNTEETIKNKKMENEELNKTMANANILETIDSTIKTNKEFIMNHINGEPKSAPAEVKTKKKARKCSVQKSKSNHKTRRPQMKAEDKNKKNKSVLSEPLPPPPLTMQNYVVPKVVRYYNHSQQQQQQQQFPYIPVDCFQKSSLLPAVHTPHFTKQPTVPISFLTPENSQIVPHKAQEATTTVIETKRSSSPAMSDSSLQHFFEINELMDIFDTEKTIYYLSELHVRALAHTLNINVENLILIIDKIVETDDNILREKCKIKEEEEGERDIIYPHFAFQN